jgi:hypothetical protein
MLDWKHTEYGGKIVILDIFAAVVAVTAGEEATVTRRHSNTMMTILSKEQRSKIMTAARTRKASSFVSFQPSSEYNRKKRVLSHRGKFIHR